MLFPENVSFWFYLPWAICYSWFLRQPLKTVVSLSLRLEGQEIIKRRIHSSLGTHLQEGTASLGGWARGRGGHIPTGRVTAVTCWVPSGRGWDSAVPETASHTFQGSPPTFPQFSKGKKRWIAPITDIYTCFSPLFLFYVREQDG